MALPSKKKCSNKSTASKLLSSNHKFKLAGMERPMKLSRLKVIISLALSSLHTKLTTLLAVKH